MRHFRFATALLALCALPATPALARDGLGIFDDWGAFRDPNVPRCYAIAMAAGSRGRKNDFQPFATVGLWPKQGLRNEVHFRLSRRLAAGSPARLRIGDQSFDLATGQGDAWAQDKRMDAAIVAAMRSATGMTVTARAADGRAVRDSYRLSGAGSAIDAASLGCAQG
nr:invasion associated locus B family protein [Novosphingobium lentum]